jgi:hypothetical protein
MSSGAGESGELESADGTTSTLSTSWPCSSRSLTTARPALPLPPVTAILVIAGSFQGDEFAASRQS